MSNLLPLQQAKAKQLMKLCDAADAYGMFLKVDYELVGKISFRRFDNTVKASSSISTLMHESEDMKLHYAKLQVPISFMVNNTAYNSNSYFQTYYIGACSAYWKAWMFDKLCEMSSNGMRLVISRSIKANINGMVAKSKAIDIILDRYEGDRLQVEAELEAPIYSSLEYSSLDEPIPF